MNWKKWVLAAVIAVVVGVVGVPFAYIHFVEGKAPAPLALGANTNPATVAASGSLDGTWNVASGSVAGYRVNEVLFGQSATAVGRTSSITGSLVVDRTTVKSGKVTVDMSSVTSDRQQRDNQFRGRIMQTDAYPTATFSFTTPVDVGSVPAVGSAATYTVTGQLTLHGVTRNVTVALTGRRTASQFQISGSIPVTFADYDIGNPSFGPVTTEDHGSLEFALNFAHA